MRELLGSLRDSPTQPEPGLADLADICARATTAEVRLTLERDDADRCRQVSSCRCVASSSSYCGSCRTIPRPGCDCTSTSRLAGLTSSLPAPQRSASTSSRFGPSRMLGQLCTAATSRSPTSRVGGEPKCGCGSSPRMAEPVALYGRAGRLGRLYRRRPVGLYHPAGNSVADAVVFLVTAPAAASCAWRSVCSPAASPLSSGWPPDRGPPVGRSGPLPGRDHHRVLARRIGSALAPPPNQRITRTRLRTRIRARCLPPRSPALRTHPNRPRTTRHRRPQPQRHRHRGQRRSTPATRRSQRAELLHTVSELIDQVRNDINGLARLLDDPSTPARPSQN